MKKIIIIGMALALFSCQKVMDVIVPAKTPPVVSVPTTNHYLTVIEDTVVIGTGVETFNLSIPKYNGVDSLYAATFETIGTSYNSVYIKNVGQSDETNYFTMVRSEFMQGQLFHDIGYFLHGVDLGYMTFSIENSYGDYIMHPQDSVNVPPFYSLNKQRLLYDSVTNNLNAFKGSDSIRLTYTPNTGINGGLNVLIASANHDTTKVRFTYYTYKK